MRGEDLAAYTLQAIARTDIMPSQRCILIALAANPNGLTTQELMVSAGVKGHNRKSLQRMMAFLVGKRRVSSQRTYSRHGYARLYRISLNDYADFKGTRPPPPASLPSG